MEILIKGKQGNSRRYKLQPISEDTNNKDSFVMNTSEDDKVIIEGFTIDDPDEAFSETRSRQSSSASLFSSSNDASSTAIDTTVDDCRVTVNTFQSKDEVCMFVNDKCVNHDLLAEFLRTGCSIP